MAPSDKKSLKEIAQDSNPSQLGDPVSLKAETSNTEPTDQDRGAKGGEKSLKQIAEDKMKTNPTQLGDPVSLKAETSDTEPTNDDRGARGPTKSSGKPKM
ncbi:hypothetical protein CLAFUW4_01714 [Fulvia fulva]|uniref:Uncharacterized protein n=1 Tax=Passalora fulva TaxID=5499 RepID=A0A9Q8P3K1_PASFU|nr:uncharacterized protein CLAFUR5_01711 [Fulvia fulva]KAK4636314.1 hypothetical protein CLAFUR4_01712 [Fulvia fulva]KAK4637853.1 hypothetical protein CLAFUR0_01713 [Fulvia fulva]UJO12013.1 hypothetical protein CLAFUR5_01711 [Fulvia fulva]WPV09789.1 hypothetical protein CLAFUW4_01714 [Fulvia fulva]WPV23391.1 hypothetical protein CLAFUW7_01716 [Fulvia fulva]